MSKHISATELTRRGFLAVGGAVAVGTLVVPLIGCGSGGGFVAPGPDTTKAYRLSTRRVDSASNAAKLHAGNMRFVSAAVADANRAHPGDKSKIVPIDIKPTTWQMWFGNGAQQVDLRKI